MAKVLYCLMEGCMPSLHSNHVFFSLVRFFVLLYPSLSIFAPVVGNYTICMHLIYISPGGTHNFSVVLSVRP